jgi:hypothetical protein
MLSSEKIEFYEQIMKCTFVVAVLDISIRLLSVTRARIWEKPCSMVNLKNKT